MVSYAWHSNVWEAEAHGTLLWVLGQSWPQSDIILKEKKNKKEEIKKLKEENKRNDLAGLGDPWIPEAAKPTVILFYSPHPVLLVIAAEPFINGR